MPKQFNINYGNKLEFFCKGDNSAKKTKRVILKYNEPAAFSVECVPSSKKKKTRRKSSPNSVSTSKKKTRRKSSPNSVSTSKKKTRGKSSPTSGTSKTRSASAIAKATTPTDDKPQSILQALRKGDDAAFPHPIIDGLYLGYNSKMQPPIKTKTDKRNPARRIAVEKREKQRDHIRSFLKKNPELQRIHNLMIADSTHNTSLPNIIKELQKKNPDTTLSSLIKSAKKIQKNRISMLKSQSLQALSSPTSEMKKNSLETSIGSPDSSAMSMSKKARYGGGRQGQKIRSRKKRKTKKKKNKKKKKKTRQKNNKANR